MLVRISVVVVAIVISVSGQPLDPNEGDARSVSQVFGIRKKVGDLVHNIWNNWNSILWCGSINCSNFPEVSSFPGADAETSKPDEETSGTTPSNPEPTSKSTTTTSATSSSVEPTKSP
uniref:Uncharacterized protein n=1 Tax=Lygus hesperus TaxID=30085 RepID=A0A0A9YNB3_LYGHE